MKEYINRRNPVLPLKYHVPDSEGHVMPDGRLYIYGSYDDREDIYCSEKYHVVSTPDLEHWTVHEEAFNGNQVPWFRDSDVSKYPGLDWSRPTPFIRKMLESVAADGDDMKEKFDQMEETEKPALLFAPDCTAKNGKYYLYFCMQDESEGVAVSDRPEGPFTDPVMLPCGGIDPAVFIDDDGQAYYYWGQLFSHGVKLHEDMVSFDREDIVDDLVTEEEHFFHEGSSMRKIGDTYYYVYADMERGKPTSLGYATSKSPLGPFTYQGIIIDNDGCDPQSWNNHGSIEQVNGQWYVFYHRCSRNRQQHRRLCIEPITVGADGKIAEVKMTSQGVGAPFVPGEAIMGYQACGLKGTVYIGLNEEEETKEKYPEKLMCISQGDEIIFRYVRSKTAWQGVKMVCRGSGAVEILMNGKSAGSVKVTEEDSRNNGNAVGTLQMPSGEYELTLRVKEADRLEIMEILLY